jgi:hypothetical protein
VQDNPVKMDDPSTWDPKLDAVVAAPKNHKVLFENEHLRVLEVTLDVNEEEPVHHHRWPSVFVFDAIEPPIHDFSPDGAQLPPNRDVVRAVNAWDGRGCLVVRMAPQPAGRVLNASSKNLHGIRVEMKKAGSR